MSRSTETATEHLRRLYLVDRVPVAKIAAELGCSERTVRYRLRAAGIGRRPPLEVPPAEPALPKIPQLHDAGYLAERVAQGLTLTAIGADIGCTRQAVARALKRHGLELPTATRKYVRSTYRR